MKLLCAVALAAVLPAMGQNMPRGSFAWWDTPVVKDLNLTKEQMQKVQSTVHDSRGRLIDLHAAVQKAELDVEDAFNAEAFDMKKASDAVERLSAARAETGKALAQLSLNLRAVLTIDQWRELQKRHPGMMRGERRMNMRPGMRPRGPMGPGGMQGPGGAGPGGPGPGTAGPDAMLRPGEGADQGPIAPDDQNNASEPTTPPSN